MYEYICPLFPNENDESYIGVSSYKCKIEGIFLL